MTIIKDIDAYIVAAGKLLTSSPSSTVTMSYSHTKSGKSIIKFKTYNPKQGICYTFSTRKQKEFSKLCNALGPRGCNVGDKEMDGLSLVLINASKDEIVTAEETPNEATTTPIVENKKVQEGSQSTGGKKKKKGKKH